MSLHLSVISFEGNCLEKVSDLLEELQYKVEGPPVVADRASVVGLLTSTTDNANTVRKAAYYAHGWTHVVDPEMVLMLEHDILARISREIQAKVVGWMCEEASGSYGLVYFADGRLQRDVISVDGDVTEIAEPLIEENGLDWATATSEDVLEIVGRIGAQYGELKDDVPYYVYLLDESAMTL